MADYSFQSILYIISALCYTLLLLFCVLTGRQVATLKFVFQGEAQGTMFYWDEAGISVKLLSAVIYIPYIFLLYLMELFCNFKVS